MADYATRYATKREDRLEAEIAGVYRKAQRDMIKRLRDFIRQHKAKDEIMRKQLEAGVITKSQYKRWLRQEVFAGKQWQKKIRDATKVMLNADKQAANLINNGTIDVFQESANYAAYDIEQGVNGAISFDLYDRDAVSRLITQKPELLPRRVVDGEKAEAWHTQQISNAVTQGIIQGESIPKLAERLIQEAGVQSVNSSIRYARTAMTGAQNAGRIERAHYAQELGIEIKKEWIATNDSKTRDEHGELDGQQRDIDEPFEVDGKEIMFPGDPSCPHGELVWNCRCTLRYVYPKYAHLRKQVRVPYKEWKEGKP